MSTKGDNTRENKSNIEDKRANAHKLVQSTALVMYCGRVSQYNNSTYKLLPNAFTSFVPSAEAVPKPG